jgi:hypothetical protein
MHPGKVGWSVGTDFLPGILRIPTVSGPAADPPRGCGRNLMLIIAVDFGALAPSTSPARSQAKAAQILNSSPRASLCRSPHRSTTRCSTSRPGSNKSSTRPATSPPRSNSGASTLTVRPSRLVPRPSTARDDWPRSTRPPTAPSRSTGTSTSPPRGARPSVPWSATPGSS